MSPTYDALKLHPNRDGEYNGPVEGYNDRGVERAISELQTKVLVVDGIEMNIGLPHRTRECGRGLSGYFDVTVTYRLPCTYSDSGKYAGDFEIKIDESIKSGKIGSYRWTPKEPDDSVDTEGVMAFLNGIEVNNGTK